MMRPFYRNPRELSKEDFSPGADRNVLANTSSIWFYDAPEVEESIGARRYRHQFELQSILKQGARMTLGSDYPFDEMGQEPLKCPPPR